MAALIANGQSLTLFGDNLFRRARPLRGESADGHAPARGRRDRRGDAEAAQRLREVPGALRRRRAAPRAAPSDAPREPARHLLAGRRAGRGAPRRSDPRAHHAPGSEDTRWQKNAQLPDWIRNHVKRYRREQRRRRSSLWTPPVGRRTGADAPAHHRPGASRSSATCCRSSTARRRPAMRSSHRRAAHPRTPAWYLNLRDDPNVDVQVGRRRSSRRRAA